MVTLTVRQYVVGMETSRIVIIVDNGRALEVVLRFSER